jgi:hypothetical protein
MMSPLRSLCLALGVALALPAGSARAAYGFFASGGSYVIINKGGAGDVYYHLSPGAGSAFQSHSFGTYTKMFGTFPAQSLVLDGFENNTFSSGFDDVMEGSLFYRVYRQGTTPPAYTELIFTDNSALGGGNERHERTGAGVSLLSNSFAPGTYVIDVYTQARVDFNPNNGSPDDVFWPDTVGVPDATRYTFDAESFVPFSGTYVIQGVPEPSTAVLFLFSLGALRFIRRQQRPAA